MQKLNCKGYTLIELVLVLGVLAILSVSAIPFFTNVGETKVEAAAKKLVSDLTYVRQLARNYNAIHGISFDATANTYTVHLYDPIGDTETAVTDPLTRTAMVIDFSQVPFLSGVDIQSPNFGGTDTVRFSSMGDPQNGTGTNLTTSGSVILEEGGATRTITIQPNTGEVSEQ